MKIMSIYADKEEWKKLLIMDTRSRIVIFHMIYITSVQCLWLQSIFVNKNIYVSLDQQRIFQKPIS